MKNYDEFIEGLQEEIEVPKEVWSKYEDTLANLPEISVQKEKRRGKRSVWIKAIASTAAVVALGTGFCMKNPVLAAKIPIIGKIFEQIEEDVTFSGNYKENANIVGAGTSDMINAVYSAKDQGVEISASEIYCDGYSIFLTAKIQVEAGGLNNIPAHYTSGFIGNDETTAQGIYTKGNWNIQKEKKSVQLSENNFEGKVLDDNTFVGMMKLDLDELTEKNDVLELQLSFIGFDDIAEQDSEDITENHKIEGDWKLSIPYTVDLENAREIPVNKKTEDGFGISKVFISPYQLVIYTDLPYTTLTEEEFTREDYEKLWGEKNKEIEAAGEVKITYEECLEERQYEFCDIVVFNQKGEPLMPRGGDAKAFVFAVKGLDISNLHIFMGQRFDEFEKESDMNTMKEKVKLEVDVEIK